MTSSTRLTYHRPDKGDHVHGAMTCHIEMDFSQFDTKGWGGVVTTRRWAQHPPLLSHPHTKGTFVDFSVTAFKTPCPMAGFKPRNLDVKRQAFMAGNDHRGVCRESLAEVNQNEKISWDEFLKMMQSPKVLGLKWSTDDLWLLQSVEMIHRRFMIHDDPWAGHLATRLRLYCSSMEECRQSQFLEEQDLRCYMIPWHNSIHQTVAPRPSICKVEEYTIWCNLFWKRAIPRWNIETSHICTLGLKGKLLPQIVGLLLHDSDDSMTHFWQKKAFDFVGDLCRSDNSSNWFFRMGMNFCLIPLGVQIYSKTFCVGKHQLHHDADLISQRRIPCQCYLTARHAVV